MTEEEYKFEHGLISEEEYARYIKKRLRLKS